LPAEVGELAESSPFPFPCPPCLWAA
jgi:hypothetical protein